MKVPSGPGRTPTTISSLPVQALATPVSPGVLIGAAGRVCQVAARGCTEILPPPQATSRNATALPTPARVTRTMSFLTRLWAAGDIATSSGCVGERVVEGVERALPVDDELEAIAGARVGHGDRHRVFTRVPDEANGEAVALPAGEFTNVASVCCGAHHGSFALMAPSCSSSATRPSPARNGSATETRNRPGGRLRDRTGPQATADTAARASRRCRRGHESRRPSPGARTVDGGLPH